MSRKLFSCLLMILMLGATPMHLHARNCCKDYGGYVPASGCAYESACYSSCFSPKMAICGIAIATMCIVIVLSDSNGKGSGTIIHAHSN